MHTLSPLEAPIAFPARIDVRAGTLLRFPVRSGKGISLRLQNPAQIRLNIRDHSLEYTFLLAHDG